MALGSNGHSERIELDWTWCAGLLTFSHLAPEEQPLRFWTPTWKPKGLPPWR